MKLAMIYTGGTIGSAGKPLIPLPANDFDTLWQRHVTPGLDPKLVIDWQWLEPVLDSNDIVPGDWGRFARMVLDAADNDAMVLLHGTDTMAWTAAALSYLLTEFNSHGQPVGRFGKPLVLTGAQRPLFEDDGIYPGTDALSNLSSAFGACQSRRNEVVLAFGGVTLCGSRIMKVSTVDDRAFAYPKRGAPCPAFPLAEPSALIEQLDRLSPHLGKKAVVSITPAPADVEFLQKQIKSAINIMGEKLGAIYLNCFGNGNFPGKDDVAPLLQAARDKGVIIVTGSQVSECIVEPSTYGAGQWLTECGAVPIGDMTTAAAQAKLTVALALGTIYDWRLEDMEKFFLTSVAGEIQV